MKHALAAAFIATIIGANWALQKFGVVPIGFGLTAPAGVFFAGLTFGLRDAIQERTGTTRVLPLIAIGAIVSWYLSDSITIPGGFVPIAIASGAAFLFAETLDLAVYTPLRQRNWKLAVIASNLVGSLADSALFLWLAFGTTDQLAGQTIAKTTMTLVALPIVAVVRRK